MQVQQMQMIQIPVTGANGQTTMQTIQIPVQGLAAMPTFTQIQVRVVYLCTLLRVVRGSIDIVVVLPMSTSWTPMLVRRFNHELPVSV